MSRATPYFAALAATLIFTTSLSAQAEPGARMGDRVVELNAVPPGLPFSPAIRAGGMIYLSGQIGNRPGTFELADGVANQTRQTMANIEAILEAADASLYDVVKCTLYLDDMNDYGTVNRIYAEYWEGPPPARSAVGAQGLALGALLEIECIARDPAAG